ncbi:MAG: hypothetical protein BM556_15100 [Bacteriovorax sp. MedPE-SWde]|nr:MAG: hypothetical protein BM556_15100 [Bacteriovorax sp. MedPE-SWde]
MSDDKKDSPFGDVIKKVVSIGVGAAFMTEESVKNALGDLPLPKDIVNGLLQNAKSSKEEFLASMKEEVSNHLSKVDPKKLVQEVLEDYDVNIEAKLSFTKKEDKE